MKWANSKPSLTWDAAGTLISENTEEISAIEICAAPKVSVCLCTFNHAPFIRRAIESVLGQVTQFPFEIIIGDDSSVDGTFEIVSHYQKSYPEQIRLLRSAENLGRHTGNGRLNFVRILRACRGSYIALIEGDDYWTDPLKLQKQADVFDCNRGISLVFHNSSIVDECDKTLTPKRSNIDTELTFDSKDYLRGDIPSISTASAMLLRKVAEELPPWFLKARNGDDAVWATAAKLGSLRYLPCVMSAYRIHPKGIWSQRHTLELDKRLEHELSWKIGMLWMVCQLPDFFGKSSAEFRNRTFNMSLDVMWLSRLTRNRQTGFRSLFSCLSHGFLALQHLPFLAKNAFFLLLPWLDKQRAAHCANEKLYSELQTPLISATPVPQKCDAT